MRHRPLVNCAGRSRESGTEYWRRAIFSVRFRAGLMTQELMTSLCLVRRRFLSVITHTDEQTPDNLPFYVTNHQTSTRKCQRNVSLHPINKVCLFPSMRLVK